jgi:peptide subunit release factor 1 (eRF1)
MRCIQCHTEILVLVDETCDEFASETAFVLLGDHVPQIPLFSQTGHEFFEADFVDRRPQTKLAGIPLL